VGLARFVNSETARGFFFAPTTCGTPFSRNFLPFSRSQWRVSASSAYLSPC